MSFSTNFSRLSSLTRRFSFAFSCSSSFPNETERRSAFLYGAPADAYAAIGALYEAHQHAVGDWLSLETHLNTQIGLRKLLSGGNGLLAQGPLPLLTVYKDALSQYGVEVEIRSPYPPGGNISPPHTQQRLRNETRALLIGGSYVAGIGWTAQ